MNNTKKIQLINELDKLYQDFNEKELPRLAWMNWLHPGSGPRQLTLDFARYTDKEGLELVDIINDWDHKLQKKKEQKRQLKIRTRVEKIEKKLGISE